MEKEKIPSFSEEEKANEKTKKRLLIFIKSLDIIVLILVLINLVDNQKKKVNVIVTLICRIENIVFQKRISNKLRRLYLIDKKDILKSYQIPLQYLTILNFYF